ncbi:MAG: hypothetical protein GYA87_08955 [Christensenellaceae bacterium]|nr:hypothetical protein [Christensenellaceae bacterium]
MRYPVDVDNKGLTLPIHIKDYKYLVEEDFKQEMLKNNLEYYNYAFLTEGSLPQKPFFKTDHH